MSQENVEIVRPRLDALDRRRRRGAARTLDPEIEWDARARRLTGRGTYRGHAGVRRFFGDLADFCGETIELTPRFIDVGDQVARAWFTSRRGSAQRHRA